MSRRTDKKKKRDKRVRKQLNQRRNMSATERVQRARQANSRVAAAARFGLLYGTQPASEPRRGFGGRPLGRRILPDGAEEIVTETGATTIRKLGPGSIPVEPQTCKMCGRCCTILSISSPIPGMPDGKPAGVPCLHLGDDNRCRLYMKPGRPRVCREYKADEICDQIEELARNG